MNTPVICFGQQPCGFFPKRFLVAKINTARALQKELGLSRQGGAKADGKIVFFYHDSDADYRETITIFNDRQTNAEVRLNFTQENKIQKKFSPLYLKRIPSGWKEETLKQLPRFMDKNTIDIFSSITAKTTADFCLEMYAKLGLLDGIEVLRSSSKDFRNQASELNTDYFADIEYENEVVRAQLIDGKFMLHEGGGKYLEIPTPKNILKEQKNPSRDNRFGWMNSVINCTHYIYGEGEKDYLDTSPFPNIKFVDREKIDNSNLAWIPN